MALARKGSQSCIFFTHLQWINHVCSTPHRLCGEAMGTVWESTVHQDGPGRQSCCFRSLLMWICKFLEHGSSVDAWVPAVHLNDCRADSSALPLLLDYHLFTSGRCLENQNKAGVLSKILTGQVHPKRPPEIVWDQWGVLASGWTP